MIMEISEKRFEKTQFMVLSTDAIVATDWQDTDNLIRQPERCLDRIVMGDNGVPRPKTVAEVGSLPTRPEEREQEGIRRLWIEYQEYKKFVRTEYVKLTEGRGVHSYEIDSRGLPNDELRRAIDARGRQYTWIQHEDQGFARQTQESTAPWIITRRCPGDELMGQLECWGMVGSYERVRMLRDDEDVRPGFAEGQRNWTGYCARLGEIIRLKEGTEAPKEEADDAVREDTASKKE